MKQTSTTKKLWLGALLVALLATLLCLAASAETYSGTCGAEGDNLTWSLNTTTGELTISGEGNMQSYSSEGSVPWYYYQSKIKKVTVKNCVTSIGDYAFYGTVLTEINIPEGVTSIGKSAFQWCTSLTSVKIGNSVTSIGDYAFYSCKSLRSVTTLDSVTSIGSYAFAGCTALTNVHIPDSVTSIGSNAFYNCTNLTSVTIGNGGTSIGYEAFENCTSLTSVTIGNGGTRIGYEAFENCTSLTSVTIGNGMMSIGDYAFYNCTNLTSVKIGNGGTSIGCGAFQDCTSLTSITIPDGVTSIDDHAFLDCYSLTSVYITDIASWCGISFSNYYSNPLYYANNLYLDGNLVTELVIPDSVTSIGNHAFYNCTSLTSVEIGDSVTSIGYEALYNCTSLASVKIGDSVTSIGYEAFYNCTSLASITVDENNSVYHSAGNCLIETESKTLIAGCKNSVIPTDRSVTSIGDYAFYNCTSLTEINIPDSVTNIGKSAFYNCTSLTEINIPDSVTSIGNHAFYNCTSLTYVYITDIASWCGISFDDRYANPLLHAHHLYLDDERVTELVIPEGVTDIGDYAFASCLSFQIVTIPDSVTSIGYEAFYNCVFLTEINIPDSVTSIGKDAFYYCSYLEKITILSKTVEICDWSSTIYRSATIYGYAGSTAEAYATKYSRTFVPLHEHSFGTTLTYDQNSHWYACSGCEEKKDEAVHSYDNGNDATCNACDYEREVVLIDASLISYQVTKGVNGSFSLRAIAGLNSLDYKNFGYEVTITTKDENGNDVVQTFSATSGKVYSSIYGGTTEYSIKEHFGYEYAGLATVTNLAIDSSYTKIEIRTFVTTFDGEVKYGRSGTLLYTGTLDEDGYPSFEVVTE